MNYTQREIKLAHEIATTLDDMESTQLHLMYAATYQEAYLRKVIAKVMAIPDHKIKKTRGALFTFLISQNGGSHKAGH